jgi:hypothetical protein
MKIVTKLQAARSLLRRAGNPELSPDTFIVRNARIPVLQLNISGIQCDVSVNNISGVENSLLVKTWCESDPRFVPLARSIKYWATHRHINDRARGTLSTYTILLQIVYFLQNRTPAILPRFESIKKTEILSQPFDELAGVMRDTPFETKIARTPVTNSEDLHTLFHEFFELWGDEALLTGVDITDDIMTFPQTGVMSLHCPLAGNDVNVMNTGTWAKIHREYVLARNLLRKGATLEELVEGRIVGNNS